MKFNLKILSVVFILTILCLSFQAGNSNNEKKGIVDDEQVALKVASTLLYSVYGERIDESLPLKARSIEDDKVWLVEGTLNYDVGGVPFIEIQKSDCKVIRFGHTK